MELQKKSKFSDYKWVVVAVSFMMVFTTLGFCSGNKSLYLKAITDTLGLKRSLFSVSDSCRYVTTAVLNLFFGELVVRLGAKKLIGCGFLSLIISCLIYATAEKIYWFYVGGCFLGMGMAWCTTTVVGYVVNKWFKENRGTIMGVILAANGLGTAVSAQIVSPIIHSQVTSPLVPGTMLGNFGYRRAYLLSALILLCVGILVLIFFKEQPKGYINTGAVPGAKKKPKRGAAWEGIPFKEAIRKPYFYIAAVCIFLTGSSLQAISGVASAHLEDVGLDTGFIATALSLHSLALAAAKILAGASFDKFGLKITVFICDSIAAVAIFMLAMVNRTSYTLAAIYEILISFAMPLETIMLPLIAADMFGERAYAQSLGLFVSINTAGYALSAPVANFVFDTTGSYRGVLIVLAAIMAMITVVFQFVLRKAGKDRAAVCAALEAQRAAVPQ